jgi:hypothetical protein
LFATRDCSDPVLLGASGPGAFVLIDDYAFYGYVSEKIAMDRFAQEMGIKILSLPTGQGLLVKPVDLR